MRCAGSVAFRLKVATSRGLLHGLVFSETSRDDNQKSTQIYEHFQSNTPNPEIPNLKSETPKTLGL